MSLGAAMRPTPSWARTKTRTTSVSAFGRRRGVNFYAAWCVSLFCVGFSGGAQCSDERDRQAKLLIRLQAPTSDTRARAPGPRTSEVFGVAIRPPPPDQFTLGAA